MADENITQQEFDIIPSNQLPAASEAEVNNGKILIISGNRVKQADADKMKGPKGDKMTFDDLSPDDIATLQEPATEAGEEVKREMLAISQEWNTNVKPATERATQSATDAAEEARTAAANVQDGKTPALENGETSTVNPDIPASLEVVFTGEYDESGNPVYKVNASIPRGPQGFEPIIQNGTIQTGQPGSAVSLTFTLIGTDPDGKPIYRADGSLPEGKPGAGNGNVEVIVNGLKAGKQYVFKPDNDNSPIGRFEEISLPSPEEETVIVAVNNWVQDGEVWKARIPVSGSDPNITEDSIIHIGADLASSDVWNAAGGKGLINSSAADGYLYVYAKSKPTAAITFNYIVGGGGGGAPSGDYVDYATYEADKQAQSTINTQLTTDVKSIKGVIAVDEKVLQPITTVSGRRLNKDGTLQSVAAWCYAEFEITDANVKDITVTGRVAQSANNCGIQYYDELNSFIGYDIPTPGASTVFTDEVLSLPEGTAKIRVQYYDSGTTVYPYALKTNAYTNVITKIEGDERYGKKIDVDYLLRVTSISTSVKALLPTSASNTTSTIRMNGDVNENSIAGYRVHSYKFNKCVEGCVFRATGRYSASGTYAMAFYDNEGKFLKGRYYSSTSGAGNVPDEDIIAPKRTYEIKVMGSAVTLPSLTFIDGEYFLDRDDVYFKEKKHLVTGAASPVHVPKPNAGYNPSYALSDLYAIYEDLALRFPNYVSSSILGYDGEATPNPIYQYRFARDMSDYMESGVSVDFPINCRPIKILACTGIHGDEKQSQIGIAHGLKWLCESTDNAAEFIKNNCEILLIPCANPSGFKLNTRENGSGVNINTQFVTEGTAECKIIADWLRSNQDATQYFDIHDGGTPPYYMSTDLNNMEMTTLQLKIRNAIQSDWESYGSSVTLARPPFISLRVSTGTPGTSKWFAFANGLSSMLIEVPNYVDPGRTEGDFYSKAAADMFLNAVSALISFNS